MKIPKQERNQPDSSTNRLELRTGATDIPFYVSGGITELGANRGTALTNSERRIELSAQLTWNANGTETSSELLTRCASFRGKGLTVTED